MEPVDLDHPDLVRLREEDAKRNDSDHGFENGGVREKLKMAASAVATAVDIAKTQAMHLLRDALADLDKLEAEFAAAEQAKGMEPNPAMPWGERIARLCR